MTDTQERVEVNLITNGKRFGFLRRLVNSCIASEWSFSITIAAVVVVGAALYHHHVISYLEARFETTVKKMLDEREQGSNAFIKEAIKESETNMLKRLLGVPKNCVELYKSGKITSGVYTINPDGAGPEFQVFCDQKNVGGGWTVVQKRLDGSVDFHRNWSDYKNGFGELDGEFWLGLEKIHRLTKSPSKLRVDLEDFDGKTAYAEYYMFVVATERTAGDSFTEHHGHPFSTMDRDNDRSSSNCAEKYKGAWWHIDCYFSNLNGVYRHKKESATKFGVRWISWREKPQSLKRAEMKIRPVEF